MYIEFCGKSFYPNLARVYIYMVLHEAAVTYADLDQGLVEVLLGRCCRDPAKIMPETLA